MAPKVATILGAGKGVAAAKPTSSHSAAGQFTLTNYDGSFTYTLTTGSRTDSVITLASATQSSDVTAQAPKGLSASAAMTVARLPLSYPTVCSSYYYACIGCGCPGGSGCHCGATDCTCACTYYPSGECAGLCGYQKCNCTCPLDTSPSGSGYVQNHGEWGRVA